MKFLIFASVATVVVMIWYGLREMIKDGKAKTNNPIFFLLPEEYRDKEK